MARVFGHDHNGYFGESDDGTIEYDEEGAIAVQGVELGQTAS